MRVLIVDDLEANRMLLSYLVEKQGNVAITCSNAEDALDAYQTHGADLVFMDVVMPGLNGFQATRQLTRAPETASIPVIIVTTKDQETDRVWGTRQGAKGYLVKPVKEDDLIKTINSLIA